MSNPFASARLIFRAPEFPEDNDFFYALDSDPIAAANSDTALHKPVMRKDVEEGNRKAADSMLLTVVICLPVSETKLDEISSSVKTNDARNNTYEDSTTLQKEPTPIGRISLTGAGPMHRHHRNSMIGINILEGYRNKGYGTEAIEWTLRWGFRSAGLHRIEIGCFGWNVGAKKLYEKMGFVPEVRKREWMWYDGGWQDLFEYSMLEHEWRETRGNKALEMK